MSSPCKNTSKNKGLIWKYKAAVVGRCSICFSVSSLYLEAAYPHRSSTAGKSLSNPFPSALTSRCQPTSSLQLQGGLLLPSHSPLHRGSPAPTPRHTATLLMLLSLVFFSLTLVSWWKLSPVARQLLASNLDAFLQRAAFSFSGSRGAVRMPHGICTRTCYKIRGATEACNLAHSSDLCSQTALSVPLSHFSKQMPTARK